MKKSLKSFTPTFNQTLSATVLSSMMIMNQTFATTNATQIVTLNANQVKNAIAETTSNASNTNNKKAVKQLNAKTAKTTKAEKFEEGFDYKKIQGAVKEPNKVIEFFSYHCPHCSSIEPQVEELKKSLPKNVTFERVQVLFHPSMIGYQKLYHTLELMGVSNTLQKKIFTAVQQEQQELHQRETAINFIKKQGLDVAKFTSIYDSMGVQAKSQQGTKLMEKYKINSVPTFIINGQYQTDMSMAREHNRLNPIILDVLKK
jgi:thiol:disulfide interchange protein DsbA